MDNGAVTLLLTFAAGVFVGCFALLALLLVAGGNRYDDRDDDGPGYHPPG